MDYGLATVVVGLAGMIFGLTVGALVGRRWGRTREQSGFRFPQGESSFSSPAQSQYHALLARRAQEQFVANMSHEIRTPLTAILGFADLLLDGEDEPATRREYLTLIRNSGRHLLELVNDVLNLAKIQAGRMRVHPVECSVHEVVREAVALYGMIAGQKGLSLNYVWKGHVPERVTTDPAKFRQMVTNLIGNALKFTQQGGVTVSLELVDGGGDPDARKQQLALRVADTGIGISREKLGEIFEPFNQADTTITRRFGGTGLGLTITREIARLLGGELSVTSQPGAGSTFTATIDPGLLDGIALLREMPAPTDESERNQRTLFDVRLERVRVLLVEDSETNRRLIGAILRRAGAEVVTAENGQIGVQKALAGSVDVILMDVQMPVLDGLSATRKLRLEGLSLPIIALTAHVLKDEVDRCRQAGCSACVGKPVDIRVLLTTIRSVLPSGGIGLPGCATGPQASTSPKPSDAIDARPSDARSEVSQRRDSGGAEASEAVLAAAGEPIEAELPIDDPEFVEVAREFVPTLKQWVADLRTAFDQGEMEAVCRVTHTLRGSAGSVGFPAFTKPAECLSRAVGEADWLRAEEALSELENLAGRVVEPARAVPERAG